MKSPAANETLERIRELIAELRTGILHIERARSKFSDMPRSLPNGTRRLDKLSQIQNELNPIIMNIIKDAHEAPWCSDEIRRELQTIQKEYEKGA